MWSTIRCSLQADDFVGIQERADWQVESWTMQGTGEECANDHAGWHYDVQALIAASPRLFKWALMGRDPLPQWTVGKVTLLGDACHPTLPMLAHGAVMAIEDAVILGSCFDKYGDVARPVALSGCPCRRHHPQGGRRQRQRQALPQSGARHRARRRGLRA